MKFVRQTTLRISLPDRNIFKNVWFVLLGYTKIIIIFALYTIYIANVFIFISISILYPTKNISYSQCFSY